MTKTELAEVLEAHGKWLRGERGGARANLGGADLRDANLGGADLGGATLRGANLGGANLGGADLWGADLWGADLWGADLWGADLGGATLRGADLWGADLRGATLRGATLRGANLGGANLRGADLWGADLRGATLRGARWSAATRWPAVSALLLADWGDVPDDLCRDLMRYDACFHPDPGAFDRWAAGGPCPYDGLAVPRAAHFAQRRECWVPGGVRPWDVWVRLRTLKLVEVK